LDIGYSQPSVQELFTVTHQYVVPPYQRPYAWEPRNVDDFWNDVSGVGDHEHFLGPMVLHNPGNDTRAVIDGQQRLTTIQLLLALIRDKYVDLGNPEVGGEKRSEAPQSLIRQSGYATRYRLQSGAANRSVLEDFVLRRPSDVERKTFKNKRHLEGLSKVERARNKDLIEAWGRLDRHVDKYLAEGSDPLKRLEELERGLVTRVSLVVLDVKDLEDAYLLFETLNDRGLRLSAADLLKSHLLQKFHERHPSDAASSEKAASTWDEMVDGLGGGDISGFLRHFLLRAHPKVRKADVFPVFKRDVADAGPEATLADLSEMGRLYAEIARPTNDGSDVSQVLADLNSTSVDSHRIALLPGLRVLATKDFLALARVAEILSFRWVVTGGNAQELEELYQEAARLIHASQGRDIASALNLLRTAWPTDEAFREEFARETLGYEYVASYALRKIEAALDPHEKVIKAPSQVHVEHIMPRTPTDFWLERAGDDVPYDQTVRRWGNLTLLLGKVNSSISNGDWDAKKHGAAGTGGYSTSAIVMTRTLASLPDWDATLIDLRARWLAIVATRVWSSEQSLAHVPALLDAIQDPDLVS
jgi:hypothetical protein